MQLDRHGLEVLSRRDCLRLLAQSRVGRVVVTDRALPACFPVTFALLEDDVVFLTACGSKLHAAEGEEVMAFEADDIDSVAQSGWSVLVQGLASVITEAGDVARAQTLGLEPWAPSSQRQFMRIRSELVSGRRLLSRAVPRPQFAGCPACGSREMLPVRNGATRNFICQACAACWHLEGGDLRRVRSQTCPGCRFKPMCTAAAARDGLVASLVSHR